MKIIRTICTLCLALFLFLACKKNDTPISSSNVNITLQTKAQVYSDVTEKAVVWVFTNNGSGYVFAYKANAEIASTTPQTMVNVTLYTTSKPCLLYLVANANVPDPLAGQTVDQVKSNAIINFNANSTLIPMWGVYELPNGITQSINQTQITVKVMRVFARNDFDANAVSANFELTSLQAFRANNKISLIPNTYNASFEVTAPSVPSTSAQTINTPPIITNSNTGTIYLPEAVQPASNYFASATCIVAGGKYNGSSKTTYYRADFIFDGFPDGQILRNRQYLFKLTEVTGPGWETPEEAANNKISNIALETEDWTTDNILVNLGGNNYFRISGREAETIDTVNATASLFVATNVSDYTLQWTDVAGNPLDVAGYSINNGTFLVSKSRNIIFIKVLKASSGVTNYFVISADRAKINVTIKQKSL